MTDLQGMGVGSQLMHAVVKELKAMPANGCVLLGDPEYYYRFGFKPVDGLVLPAFRRKYFQALLFQGDYPQGVVTYHEAFSAIA